MTLLERIKQSPPHWAEDRIMPFDEDDFREALPFLVRRYWCDCGSVNVFRIVGTRHPDYQNMSWRWLIENGKRMPENMELHRTNPGYYLETARKVPEMTFITMDGLDYYVNTDGNHRSAIARFDFHYRGVTTLHGVTIEDVRIDRDLLGCYRKIRSFLEKRSLPFLVDPVSEKRSREDTAGWMLETFAPKIRIRGEGKDVVLSERNQAEEWLREIGSRTRKKPEPDRGFWKNLMRRRRGGDFHEP